jgi:HEAT repeat protein
MDLFTVIANQEMYRAIDRTRIAQEKKCEQLNTSERIVQTSPIISVEQKPSDEQIRRWVGQLKLCYNSKVRCRAALQLCSAEGNESAITALTQMLEDKDTELCHNAIIALGHISKNDFSVIKALGFLLHSNDRSPAIRAQAAAAMGEIGDASSVWILLAAVKIYGEKSLIGHAANNALNEINANDSMPLPHRVLASNKLNSSEKYMTLEYMRVHGFHIFCASSELTLKSYLASVATQKSLDENVRNGVQEVEEEIQRREYAKTLGRGTTQYSNDTLLHYCITDPANDFPATLLRAGDQQYPEAWVNRSNSAGNDPHSQNQAR